MIARGPITQICWVTDDLDAACVAAEPPYVELARIGPQVRDFYAAVKARSQEGSR